MKPLPKKPPRPARKDVQGTRQRRAWPAAERVPGQTGAGAQTRRKRIASEADPGERLHKILAQAGIASRREVETWILAGRVQVNGRTAQVGQRVAHDDKVKVNGRLVTLHFTDRLPRVILYHKPEGEIVSRDDPEGRSSVFSALPRLRGERWVAVGRLDINTSGLLLFTTSGKLANQLMHPSSSLLREYAARILGDLPLEAQQRLCDGVQLEDGSACFHTLEDAGGQGANHWYRVSLHEGRNREVRRLFEAVGVKVSRLMRIRYGPFALPPRLKRGQCLELAPAEVRHLVAFLKERGGDAQTRENYAPKTQGPVFSTPKRRPAKDQRDL